MKEKLIYLLSKYRDAFAADKEALDAIIGHEEYIIMNVEKPHPPLLTRPAYPSSPGDRGALEVEVTSPIIITWHNGKSRMVGDFRALSSYTISNRYPIRRIHETSTQLSQAKFITTMEALKGFTKISQQTIPENNQG
ncbi:hypothetical protein O181_061174 [Austropuccinia psidii MF-1]|uniref:Uncharacterized protein n=1 Tax=Austropuccinia psidii MF-1 TaxID=1389203 RepID=A0A9Q3EHM6_9BASI|nr:hypothetical protein [Austropuccinia psidii MF-1]